MLKYIATFIHFNGIYNLKTFLTFTSKNNRCFNFEIVFLKTSNIALEKKIRHLHKQFIKKMYPY